MIVCTDMTYPYVQDFVNGRKSSLRIHVNSGLEFKRRALCSADVALAVSGTVGKRLVDWSDLS